MDLAFLVLEGPQKGQKFHIKPGTTIGRQDVDILFDDPKVSLQHAIIELDDQEQLQIKDLGSTNGIKVNGTKVSQFRLNPGLRIQIGQSLLEVLIAPTPLDLQNQKTAQWNDILIEYLKKKIPKIQNTPKPIIPFDPPLILTFTRGVQFETQWYLGYGPRQIGSESIDLPILESSAPPLCFEVLPSLKGPIIKTSFPQIVLINDQSLSTHNLKSGDRVTILGTKIRLDFDETN